MTSDTTKELNRIKRELAALKRQVQSQNEDSKCLKIAKVLAYADFKYYNNYSNPEKHWETVKRDKINVERYYRMADAVLNLMEQ
jgi:hypothetical protein